MLNFRFHIVSLVAVFLSLAIGIIMGSTVIDRALVDTLEDQQQSLRADLDDLSEENGTLRQELGDLREAGDRLAVEGGERLLSATLADVPVLVVAVRGIDTGLLDDLGALLATAGAADQGTLWLTDRLALPDEESVADLRTVLGRAVGADAGAVELRAAAASAVATAIRAAVDDDGAGDGPVGTGDGQPGGAGGAGEGDAATEGGGTVDPGAAPDSGAPAPGPDQTEGPAPAGATTTVVSGGEGEASVEVLLALRDAGFVEYDAPEGKPDDIADLAVPGTRVVLVSGPGVDVADAELALPLAVALVSPQRPGTAAPVDLLAAEGIPPVDEARDEEEDGADVPGLVELLRDDDAGDRLSTVDNLDAFAGRVAAVVAVQDLGAGRRGHYGVGPGAQRLVPAPAG